MFQSISRHIPRLSTTFYMTSTNSTKLTRISRAVSVLKQLSREYTFETNIKDIYFWRSIGKREPLILPSKFQVYTFLHHHSQTFFTQEITNNQKIINSSFQTRPPFKIPLLKHHHIKTLFSFTMHHKLSTEFIVGFSTPWNSIILI